MNLERIEQILRLRRLRGSAQDDTQQAIGCSALLVTVHWPSKRRDALPLQGDGFGKTTSSGVTRHLTLTLSLRPPEGEGRGALSALRATSPLRWGSKGGWCRPYYAVTVKAGGRENQIATSASLPFGLLAMTWLGCAWLYVIARSIREDTTWQSDALVKN